MDGEVWYAGAAPNMVAGVFQINVKVPAGAPSGEVPVIVKVGPLASPGTATAAVR